MIRKGGIISPFPILFFSDRLLMAIAVKLAIFVNNEIMGMIFRQVSYRLNTILLVLCFAHSAMGITNIAGDTYPFVSKTFVQASYHRGSMYPHHEYLRFFNHDYINGFELQLVKSFPHLRPHRPPVIGVGLYHSGLGNRDIYGTITGLNFAFISNYFSLGNVFTLGSTVSSGVSYASKPYNPDSNPFNQAIGSRLNALIVLSIDFKINIDKSLSLFVSPTYTHSSNGKMKLPNTGLNLYALQVGASYTVNQKEIVPISPELPAKVSSRARIIGLYAAGVRQNSKRNPFAEFASSSMLEFTYSLNANHRIGFGGDIFQSTNITKNLNELQLAEADYTTTYGVHLAYEIVWGKLSFALQPGYMVVPNSLTPSRIFKRVGIRYNVYDGFFVNCSLKATQFAADYIEWGVGYNLNFLKR